LRCTFTAIIPIAQYLTRLPKQSLPRSIMVLLLRWGVSTADKTDYERMRRESISFTQMLLELSRVPVNELRWPGIGS